MGLESKFETALALVDDTLEDRLCLAIQLPTRHHQVAPRPAGLVEPQQRLPKLTPDESGIPQVDRKASEKDSSA